MWTFLVLSMCLIWPRGGVQCLTFHCDPSCAIHSTCISSQLCICDMGFHVDSGNCVADDPISTVSYTARRLCGEANRTVQSIREEKLKFSIRNGYLADIQELVENGADIRKYIQPAFLWACMRGHLKVVQWLYSLGGVDIHMKDDLPFRLACERNRIEVAKWIYLQDGGVDVRKHFGERSMWIVLPDIFEIAMMCWTKRERIFRSDVDFYEFAEKFDTIMAALDDDQ